MKPQDTTSVIVKIRVLAIGFENEIHREEIRYFRSAVSDIAGPKHILFHNHAGDGYRYSYPLIQYKTWYRKPMILCINEGVDEVHHFFENRQGNIILGNREYDLHVSRINLNRFTMQTWDKTFRYRIHNWLPLNQKNYEAYKLLGDDIERTEFLNNILFGNILSFAKGVGWILDKEKLKVRIHDTVRQSVVRVKNVLRETYTVDFSTNAFLPDFIGLGKNVSTGFGTVKSLHKKNEK